MAIEPETFEVGASKLRWTKLPALVLAREHGKLIQRADHGALDMLAFQITQSDQEALLRREPSAIFLILKTVANVLGEDNLDELCLHYLSIGRVEVAVEGGGKTAWLPLYGDKAAENLEFLADAADMYGGVWKVLGGLFAPLAKLLPASNDEAPEQASGNDSSKASETTSPEAPTSETTSYS